MEKLFFLLQSDKQFKRQIQLLKYLSTQTMPLATADLARQLDCTKPTLLNDINMLNYNMPEGIKIEKEIKDGIQLIHADNMSIDSYITQMAKDSLVFRIIDAIFHNKIYSFLRAQDEFFVSKTVLRKMLNHMNNILKPFHVSISTINLDFVGEEADIRFFLFAFYTDFRDAFVVKSEDDIHAESYADLLISARAKNLPRLHFSYFRATIWIMIIKQRLFYKHHVSISDFLQQEIHKHISFAPFQQIFHQSLKKVFNFQKLPDSEAIWGYIVSLHCISYSDACFMNENETFVYRREEQPEVLAEIHEFLQPLLGKELEASPTWHRLEAFLVNLRLLSKLTPMFAAVSLPLQEFVKDSDAYIYHKWLDHIENTKPNTLFSLAFKNDVATTLTLLYSATIEDIKKTKPLHILFSLQGESGYDEFLVKSCKLLLRDNVKANFSFEKSITKQMIETTQADMVVCNYDLPFIENPPCPIIRLSYIPTVVEWTALKNRIYDL